MRTISFLLIVLIFCFNSYAQEEKEMKTLFGDGKIIGAFGSFDIKTGPVRDNINLFLGGHGGIIFNSNFYVGLGGYGLSTIENFNGEDPNVLESDTVNRNVNIDMSMGYGGIILGYTIAPNSIIHVDFPVLIGAGGVRLGDNEVSIYNQDFPVSPLVENSAFFVVEPGLNVEINLASFCKMGIGGGYRYVYGTDMLNVSDNDLSDWTANFSLKFGKFN